MEQVPFDKTMSFDSKATLRPNTPQVTSERFEDEVVIVNFENGTYHSLQGTAVAVWNTLPAGLSAEQVIDALSQRYPEARREEIRSEVLPFLESLLREGLILSQAPSESGATPAREGSETSPELAPLEGVSLPSAYTAPTLTTFSDMQDLLLLDPIHEVDDAGWPLPRERDDSPS